MDSKTEEKIVNIEALSAIIERLRKEGKIVVFTNGCFDLIHSGHTRYLRQARAAGDLLVVAVNSDGSVKSIKGKNRPILPLNERMEILAGFYFIDYVVSFEEPDPYKVIKKLRPSALVKGGDWPLNKIIGKDIVEKDGGSVHTIPLVHGRSTSSIIKKIIESGGDKI